MTISLGTVSIPGEDLISKLCGGTGDPGRKHRHAMRSLCRLRVTATEQTGLYVFGLALSLFCVRPTHAIGLLLSFLFN